MITTLDSLFCFFFHSIGKTHFAVLLSGCRASECCHLCLISRTSLLICPIFSWTFVSGFQSITTVYARDINALHRFKKWVLGGYVINSQIEFWLKFILSWFLSLQCRATDDGSEGIIALWQSTCMKSQINSQVFLVYKKFLSTVEGPEIFASHPQWVTSQSRQPP